MNAKGIYYSKETLSNFYISLKSKPFVILSGISGTGKSKLVRHFANAIGAEFIPISVRPDWSDATELIGYKDLSQVFHPGSLTVAIQKAKQNPDKPFIVCLDEMNLARVEYYFSDFLSLIELRRNEEYGLLSEEEAFDFQLLQKILPRITGTSRKVELLLMRPINLWTDEMISIKDLEDTVEDGQVLSKAYYPRSVKKLLQMLRGYRDDGFTSFW